MVQVLPQQSASFLFELAILQDGNQRLPQRLVHENFQSIDLYLKQIPVDEVGYTESGSDSSIEEAKEPRLSQLTYSGAHKRPEKKIEQKSQVT